MVRDLYSRDRAARVLSTLMTVMAVAPLVGPTVGGQILRVADWPAIFWTLVAIGLATLLALTTIPETLPRDRRTAEPMGQALAGYGELLGNHRLMGYAAAGGVYFAGVFAYVAGTPSPSSATTVSAHSSTASSSPPGSWGPWSRTSSTRGW